jgi:hypothetical protein
MPVWAVMSGAAVKGATATLLLLQLALSSLAKQQLLLLINISYQFTPAGPLRA